MVLEQNNLEQKTKELDELIDLAEKVSFQIKLLRNKERLYYFVFITFVIFGTSILYIYYAKSMSDYFIFNNVLNIVIIYSITIMNILFMTIQSRKIMKAIKQETTILNKLHDMITVHKNGFERELGVVSNAIYEMKLSRIEFNFDNPSKNPFFRLITSILG